MKQKTIKILSIIVITIALISISVNSFALIAPNSVEPTVNSKASTSIGNVGNSIVGILQTVGVVLSVVILIVLGIKYMMGSSEEKAEYKKTMIPYLVGAALIFAASIFANVVYEFFSGIK